MINRSYLSNAIKTINREEVFCKIINYILYTITDESIQYCTLFNEPKFSQ